MKIRNDEKKRDAQVYERRYERYQDTKIPRYQGVEFCILNKIVELNKLSLFRYDNNIIF